MREKILKLCICTFKAVARLSALGGKEGAIENFFIFRKNCQNINKFSIFEKFLLNFKENLRKFKKNLKQYYEYIKFEKNSKKYLKNFNKFLKIFQNIFKKVFKKNFKKCFENLKIFIEKLRKF